MSPNIQCVDVFKSLNSPIFYLYSIVLKAVYDDKMVILCCRNAYIVTN